MPVEASFTRSNNMSYRADAMSQSFNKPNFYVNQDKYHATTVGGGGGMMGGNRGPNDFYHQADPYRFPNNFQLNVKAANPPLKMLVPSDMVGAIIGRGGATIREITKASRARVDVHRNYDTDAGNQTVTANAILPGLSGAPATSEKVISIFGKEGDSITTACKKILEVMDGEFKKIRQNRLECGFNFINGFVPQMPVMETALKMLAPNALVGRIIGKQGKKVNEIKDKTGAKITVSNVFDINAENPERTIIVTGSLEAISSAESRISDILRACHQQEAAKFPAHEANDGPYRDESFGPSGYANYQGSTLGRGGVGGGGGGGGAQAHLIGQPAMIGSGVIDPATSSSFGHAPMLPHQHTQVPPPQFGHSPPFNSPPYNGPDPANQSQQQQQQQLRPFNPMQNHFPPPPPAPPSAQPLDTVFLYVPASSVGAIIGKKGESVRQITRSTCATIKIAAEKEKRDGEPDSPDSPLGDVPAPPRDASSTPGEKSVAITAPFDSQRRAIAQIFKKLYEERFFGGDPPFLALDVLVPASQMGKVLGKQKIKIRTIERRTGVVIRVPDNKAAPGDAEDENRDGAVSYVTIRGALPQMLQAMTMIKEILHGDALPAFRPPMPPFPPFPRNLYHYPPRGGGRGGRGRPRL